MIEKVDLSPETADRIVATVRKTSAERELFAELSEIGISYGACAKAIKWFGNNAISCLRKDPYAYGKKIGLSYKQEELLCKHFHTAQIHPAGFVHVQKRHLIMSLQVAIFGLTCVCTIRK